MEANLELVDRYGLPLVLLALLVLAAWRVWRFVQPLVRDTLQENILLLKGLREETSANTASLRRQADALAAHAEALTLNAAFLRKIYDSLFVKPSKPSSDRPPTLLVVEDSATDYLFLRKRLAPLIENMGLEVVHAESLAEAVRKIDVVDAIILDLLLPDANDARTSKVFAELTALPIIVHTGSHEPEADKLAEAIGAPIVRKDQPVEVLEAAVRQVLERVAAAKK